MLPDRSVGAAGAQVARAQHDINAANIEDNRHTALQTAHIINDIQVRKAEADNTTWVNENVVQYKKDASDAVTALRQQRAANPKDFHKDFDKELEKTQIDFLNKAPSEAARIAMKATTNNIRASMYDENQQWENERQVAGFGERMDRTADNLGVMAYRAGQDGKDLDQTGLMKDVHASVVAGSTFVAPDKIDHIGRTMSKNVVSNYVEGMFEKNPAKAKEILNSRKYDKILGPEELAKFDSKIKAQDRIEIDDQVDNITTAAKMGIAVPDKTLTDTITKMEGAGMRTQAQNLREFQAIQGETITFAKKPMTEQASELKTMKAAVEGGDMTQVRKYSAMASIFQTKQEAINKDPWAYYAARDVVADPQPLNFNDPKAMAAEFDRRRIAVQQVKDLDGITMPLFNDNELDSLKKVYERAKPEEIAPLMASMGNSMKPEEQAALAQAMAPKSPNLAVALAVGDPQVGEKILIGAQIDGLVKKDDVRAQVQKKLESVVTDPIRFEKLNDAIYSYYKTIQYQARDNNATVNDDYLDKAITSIMGPVVDIDGLGGSSKVLTYKDKTTGAYVDGDRLEETLKSLTDDKIKLLNNGKLPVGTTGVKFTAKDIYNSGRFVSNGDGMYAVIDEQGEPIGNEDGSVFQIDARKLSSMTVIK